MTVRVPIVSDSGSAFLSGALQWLVGMAPGIHQEAIWTAEEVRKKIISTESSVVALVMSDEEIKDGEIVCGPQVTAAILACAEIKKDYCFLVPLSAESRLVVVDGDVMMVVDGDVMISAGRFKFPQPRGIITSDIRMLVALAARVVEEGEVVP